MRHLLFICLLLFCVACEENESVDPTIMPEATTTGANTFGCLVDGWVYTSGRWGMPAAEYLEREEGSSVTVSAQVGLGSYIRFTIADPKEGETLPYVNLSFENHAGCFAPGITVLSHRFTDSVQEWRLPPHLHSLGLPLASPDYTRLSAAQ